MAWRKSLSRAHAWGVQKGWIGDRAFYRIVLAIVIPIIIQNSISNFVSLLDNLMVNRVGETQMGGVSLANQLVFIYNLCIFGGISGASIYAAQFFGAGNRDGFAHAFRFQLYVCIGLTALFWVVFTRFEEPLLLRFITEEERSGPNAQEIMSAGREYLATMRWGLLFFAIAQAYAGTLRIAGETRLPMIASVIAVLVNLLFNTLLIFGYLGFPRLGVRGAAIATVISRVVELAMVAGVAHRRVHRYPFLQGIYRRLTVPLSLVKAISVRGLPLLFNEALWSLGMMELTRLYSQRGLHVISALTIASTVMNLFSVFYFSLGNAASILAGQALGARDMTGARRIARQLIAFQLLICVSIGLLLAVLSPVIPRIYSNLTPESLHLSTVFILIQAIMVPAGGFTHVSYFILRSGGRTIITFLFDSAYTWIVLVSLAWLLVYRTTLPIIPLYMICHLSDLLKAVVGYILVKKGVWIRNIIHESDAQA